MEDAGEKQPNLSRREFIKTSWITALASLLLQACGRKRLAAMDEAAVTQQQEFLENNPEALAVLMAEIPQAAKDRSVRIAMETIDSENLTVTNEGGSGTIIQETGDQLVILTARHVVCPKGKSPGGAMIVQPLKTREYYRLLIYCQRCWEKYKR